MPDSVGWIMREMRNELARRDYSADDCGDVLNGRHVIFFPDREDWLKVYPLKDVDPWEESRKAIERIDHVNARRTKASRTTS